MNPVGAGSPPQLTAFAVLPRDPLRGKRQFDVVISALALALLAPALGVIWLVVRVTSRGPGIYRGQRVGLGGADFEILKFRTMWDKQTDQLTTARDDARVTPVGRKLRRYKLDELPQLVNVLRGDMSIVGPRPEFRRWVNLYGPDDRRALSVRPGITDFASLEFIKMDEFVGSSDADARYIADAFARKNSLRVRYVDELKWSTDLKLIGRTLAALFKRGR